MSEQNGNGGDAIGVPGNGVIHVEPQPAPVVVSSVGDAIARADPAKMDAEQARAAIKGIGANPALLAALQTPSDPAHKTALAWHKQAQAIAYGTPATVEVDEESGFSIGPQSETISFAVPEAPEGYAEFLAAEADQEADTALQEAAGNALHALGVDGHTASTLRHVWNTEARRPLSIEARNTIASRTRARFEAEMGKEAFTAKLKAANEFLHQRCGPHYPTVQHALLNSSLGVSEYVVRRIFSLMDRAQ